MLLSNIFQNIIQGTLRTTKYNGYTARQDKSYQSYWHRNQYHGRGKKIRGILSLIIFLG